MSNPTLTAEEIAKTANTWSIVRDPDAYRAALAIAKGPYQESIIAGDESVSGSTLTGKAKRYGSSYARSRKALLARLREAGIPHCVTIGANRRHVLVIGEVTA